MDATGSAGAFLHELSAVERAQPQGLLTEIALGANAARVQCRTGAPLFIPLDSGRARIAQMLSHHAGPVTAPPPEDPRTYPDAPTPQQLWCELLEDLGAHYEDLSHADPDLRLASVRRDGLIARIQVTNGARELTYDVPLDSHQMPAAVTVEIARVFPGDPADH
jgi:hypothetical protein